MIDETASTLDSFPLTEWAENGESVRLRLRPTAEASLRASLQGDKVDVLIAHIERSAAETFGRHEFETLDDGHTQRAFMFGTDCKKSWLRNVHADEIIPSEAIPEHLAHMYGQIDVPLISESMTKNKDCVSLLFSRECFDVIFDPSEQIHYT